MFKRVARTLYGEAYSAACLTYRAVGVRIVTSSSAAVGCSAIVASKSALVAFIFTAAGLPIVSDTLTGLVGQGFSKSLSIFSILDQFEGLNRGVIEARAIVFFLSFIAAWLAVTTLFVDARRRVGS